MIRAVLFDFGGVIAEEGFREGLKEIARKNGLDPDEFYRFVTDFIFESGYLTGHASERDFWFALKERFNIKGNIDELREEILRRFIIRPGMLRLVGELRKRGYRVGILSDQTNWLDELNKRFRFFDSFDYVFNSYHMKKAKRQLELFQQVVEEMGVSPDEVLFVDDTEVNVTKAREAGFRAVLFSDVDSLRELLKEKGVL